MNILIRGVNSDHSYIDVVVYSKSKEAAYMELIEHLSIEADTVEELQHELQSIGFIVKGSNEEYEELITIPINMYKDDELF